MEQQKREGKTMKAEKIIDSLKFTFEEADEQKDLFTPSHVLYKCLNFIQPGKPTQNAFILLLILTH
jgi:hypothetical protein